MKFTLALLLQQTLSNSRFLEKSEDLLAQVKHKF